MKRVKPRIRAKVKKGYCPKCLKKCVGIFPKKIKVRGKVYTYLYAAHYKTNHRVSWHYVGKDRVRRKRAEPEQPLPKPEGSGSHD
jgi:hypothetical protein